MLTKTQIKILEVFTSKINKKFSINEISQLLGKPYALIYRSLKDLISDNFILIDEKKLLSLNYKSNFAELSFIESERLKKTLAKEKSLSLFIKDFLNEINEDFFIFMIFGSFVEKKNFNDIDFLVIVDEQSKINKTEKILNNISSNFSFKTDTHVLSKDSAYEMISKREQLNIMNESLNKHLIIFGGENYYRILKNARR